MWKGWNLFQDAAKVQIQFDWCKSGPALVVEWRKSGLTDYIFTNTSKVYIVVLCIIIFI